MEEGSVRRYLQGRHGRVNSLFSLGAERVWSSSLNGSGDGVGEVV